MSNKELVDIARLEEKVSSIKETVEEMNRKMDGFVTQQEFLPVKAIAYGLVALILSGVVGYWVTNSFRQPCCATVTTSLNP